MSTKSIIVQDVEIQVASISEDDHISLTDMARYRDNERVNYIIQNWIRNRNTIEFIGLWEKLNNPNFKGIEFDAFREKAGLNSFTMTPKAWIEKTNAIGIISKSGRYGGTYAHKDIAFEFGAWLSPEFKLYLIKEFQRLKEIESKSNNIEWNIRRSLAKANYKIHTDAIKENLIPPVVTQREEGLIYASEADLLNRALFGMTAKDWRDENPDKEGNIRDNATVEQLVVLSALESQNALLIEQGMAKTERLKKLNDLARKHMQSLLNSPSIKKLQDKPLLN